MRDLEESEGKTAAASAGQLPQTAPLGLLSFQLLSICSSLNFKPHRGKEQKVKEKTKLLVSPLQRRLFFFILSYIEKHRGEKKGKPNVIVAAAAVVVAVALL